MFEYIRRTAHVLLIAIAFVGINILSFSPVANANDASPFVFEEVQPDGSVINLRIFGDEKFNWMEDLDGYTVVHSKSKREYVYGNRDSAGRVVATALRVGRDNPAEAGLGKRIMPTQAVLNQLRSTGPQSFTSASQSGPEAVPATGTVKNLVVLVRFSDHTGRTLPSQSDVDTLFNATGGDPILAPTGSVKDFYLENSYNQLTLESTVLDWVTVPNTEAYYADGVSGSSKLWEALRYALDAADSSINFDDFDSDGDGFIDAIAFIHSGYGAEWGGSDAYGAGTNDRIWSHKWTIQSPPWTSGEGTNVQVANYHISPGVWGTSGTNIGRIGVICHETGHFLGILDLYDIDGGGEGIGSWGLMANSWGFDGSQYYPPHMCAWSKIKMGWVTPTVISAPGNYSLPQFETNASVYKIMQNFPSNEYLLVENRQPVGFEADIPQGGLTVFHIDDNAGYNTQGYPGQAGWPGNGNHYKVSLLQADGLYSLEKGHNRGNSGDVYHASGTSLLSKDTVPNTDAYQGGTVYQTSNMLWNISASGSTMTFDYSSGGINIEPDITLSDSSVSLITPTPTTVNRSFVIGNDGDSGGQDLNYTIDTSVEGFGTDTVGSTSLAYSAGTVRYRGNIYEATTNTTLAEIEAYLNFTGSANLHFVVYVMDSLVSSETKTQILSKTVSTTGVGPGFYSTGSISVPVEAGKFYIIATGWNTESIAYFGNSDAQPSVNFGNKVRGWLINDIFPMYTTFSAGISSSTINYYQRITSGAAPWFTVTPASGAITPQSINNLTVSADATGFSPGTYEGTFSITSNDPNESPVAIPVGLRVGLFGDIRVDFDYVGVEFGTIPNPYNTLIEGVDAATSSPTSLVTVVAGGTSFEMPDFSKEVTITTTGGEATISSHTPGDPVPDVIGMTQSGAEATIIAAGFVLGTVTTDYSDIIAVGDVMSQNPQGGYTAPAGASIDIVVSLGVTPGDPVPDVIGMAQAAAEATITAAGFVVGTVTTDYSNIIAAGVVMGQGPAGGTFAPPGSSVDILVSLGALIVTVPDVVGLQQTAAESAITAALLTVGSITSVYSSTIPAGEVMSQNPVGGTSASAGTSVDIEVSLGEQMVTVPDVVGLDQTTAEAAIVAALLNVGTVTTAGSDTVPVGDVISQSPTSGGSVVVGSSVDLVVSLGDTIAPNPDPMTWASVPGIPTGGSGGTQVILSTDFTGRTVSGATASNITWTADGVSDPGDMTTSAPDGLYDTGSAQGYFAPDRNFDTEGSWTTSIPLNLSVPEISLEDLVLDYQHFNNGGGFQAGNRVVTWTVTVTGSVSGVLDSVQVVGANSTSGTDTIVFSPALTLTNSESYDVTILADGSGGGNNSAIDALTFNGSIPVPTADITILSTDFTGRTVSGATASDISWTVDGVSNPGDMTTSAPDGLFDTGSAQGYFAPDRNFDTEGSWTTSATFSLTVPELSFEDVVLDYQHFNNGGGFQAGDRQVNWTVTVTGSVSGQLDSVQVNGANSTSGTETIVFNPPLTLTNSENYIVTILAEGVAGGNNSGIDALTFNGSIPIGGDSDTTIMMTATTATDANGVEYYFSNTAGPGNDSGWQDSKTYTDIGLTPGTEYTYSVIARDKSSSQNATGASVAASATTTGVAP